MKKYLIKIGAVLLFTGFLASCEEDVVVYSGTEANGLAGFNLLNQDLAVTQEGESSIIVTVDVSNAVDYDRTINVSVDPSSTALAEEYSIVTSSLVIPAGSYNGNIEIVGNFDAIPTGVSRNLLLNLDSIESTVLNETKDQIAISLYRVCPVDPTFLTGNYLLEETTPFVDGPTLEDGTVRAITADPNDPTKRSFTTYSYPNYCSTTRITFTFSLVCGEVVSSTNQGNCVCTQGQPFFFGPATENGTYDPSDDSVVYLAFTNDVTSNCGPPVQTIYKLTKQ